MVACVRGCQASLRSAVAQVAVAARSAGKRAPHTCSTASQSIAAFGRWLGTYGPEQIHAFLEATGANATHGAAWALALWKLGHVAQSLTQEFPAATASLRRELVACSDRENWVSPSAPLMRYWSRSVDQPASIKGGSP